ncbi:MAG TPA: serine hydrolase domain-containing protein [Acidimicrobiales bacterium]|nr:serine hydrolase domain-containing protein [Acidimicrobiales bacterium]
MSGEASIVPIEDELDALFGAYVIANQAPGLAYGIVSADGLGHSAGFGVANPAGAVPTLDTPFPIASMSKSFTAAAVLLCRDRGQMNLDEPITTYYPTFRAHGAPDGEVPPPTIRMLLSMSSGLTEDNSWVDPQIGMTEDELVALISTGIRYSHTPGTVYEYSNTGYTLAGLALQQATGRSIEEFVTSELLAPLGMATTEFSPSAFADDVRAAGYSLDEHDEWVPFAIAESGAFAAAGGIVSTVRDLAVWVTWLGEAFRPGRTRGTDVLSRASRRELQRLESFDTPFYALEPGGGWRLAVGGYALGLRVSYELHYGTVVAHAGGLPGYKLFMCWHPDSGDGLITLTNSHRGDPVALTHEALLKLLARHKAPAATVTLWPETVRARVRAEALIRSWDDDLAAELFAENVDFDRGLSLRRADIERLVTAIGPLGPERPVTEVISAATAADVTWSIPGERGELICMVHLTPFDPPRVQELVVEAVPADRPRSASPYDVSPRRAALGAASLSAGPNVRVVLPTTW